MGIPGNGCFESILKVETARTGDSRSAAFIFGKWTRNKVGISETFLWRVDSVSRMVRNSKIPLASKLGGGALLDKSVFFWAGGDPIMFPERDAG